MAPLMSRLEVAHRYRKFWATGDVLLSSELDLLLKDNDGQWKADTFLVHSGSEMTTIPAWLAKKMNLPMPPKAATGAMCKQTGLEIRAGPLRAWILGLDVADFTFPYCFLGDPDAHSSLSQATMLPRKLPGLSSVGDKVRILFDGTRTARARRTSGRCTTLHRIPSTTSSAFA
jgi:hypothetical protein